MRDVLAFTRDGRSSGIWLVKPDGSGLRRLTRRNDDWPAWAPGGARLAFIRAGSTFGTRNVWVVDADGTHLQRVTRGRWWLTPAWSPDGRWLAVSRTRPTKIDEVGEIWLIRPDGSRKIKLTTSPESIIDEDPAWSPDGRRIVFTRGSLHLVPAHGGRPEKLTSGRDYEPAWSIDGRRIAFVRDHLGPQDLWLLRPDGSQLKRLTRSEPGRRR